VTRADKPRILIVDDTEQFGEAVSTCLAAHAPQRLTSPDDDALRAALATPVDTVAIVTRDDVVALRYALLAEHIRPGIRLVVTIFDRTTAGEVARSVPNCTVLAMTDAIVPHLLASCLDAKPAGTRRSLRDRFGTLDVSSRALVLSFAGLLACLGLDTALAIGVLHEPWYDALWQSTRALATIGSSPAAEHGPPWYKICSVVLMLGVLALVGLFTASLVDRLTGRRLTAILGARAIPVRDHVIVVGLGQVGLRLCNELRALGVPVVAVERDEDAPCLTLAKQLRIPVVLGRGGDRFLLNRLCVAKACAVAAVSSNVLDNIAVAVTARAAAPKCRIVLRTGGAQDVADESRSLFHIGAVCDVRRIVGQVVASHVLGPDARSGRTPEPAEPGV
jgi:Trk K+ transport system NAD-binding subunit